MIKRIYRVISFRISEDDYIKLRDMQSESFPSVSAIIRDLIRMAVNSSRDIKSIELKSLENLKNPVASTEIKKTLEIPVIPSSEESSVIESATFGHRLGRKSQPNWGLVMRAYRAQKAGKEFDESLEPYFKELFSEKHP